MMWSEIMWMAVIIVAVDGLGLAIIIGTDRARARWLAEVRETVRQEGAN